MKHQLMDNNITIDDNKKVTVKLLKIQRNKYITYIYKYIQIYWTNNNLNFYIGNNINILIVLSTYNIYIILNCKEQ